MEFLRKHAEGASESDPEYWYGVIEGFGGTLWGELFYCESAARKCAETLEGTVVIIAARIIENDDGDPWPLPIRTEAIELAEAKKALDESRERFEDGLKRHIAEKPNQ